jgi:hypothetical protein
MRLHRLRRLQAVYRMRMLKLVLMPRGRKPRHGAKGSFKAYLLMCEIFVPSMLIPAINPCWLKMKA